MEPSANVNTLWLKILWLNGHHMCIAGKHCWILTGGEADGGRDGERHLKEIERKLKGSKHGLVTATYPALSPQTPPWSQGGSWGRSGASFYLQRQGNCPNSASPPKEAPELNVELLEGNTGILIKSDLAAFQEAKLKHRARETAVLG